MDQQQLEAIKLYLGLTELNQKREQERDRECLIVFGVISASIIGVLYLYSRNK